MTPLEEARARMADPTLFPQANKRMEAIDKKLQASPLNQIAKAIQSPLPKLVKVMMLQQATDILADATKGYVPCKDGCSHCCNMAVNITQDEADRLGRASGRAVAVPDQMNDDDTAAKYEGKPCPFLVDSRCSVYESRPFACRVHYSVDRDSLLCKIIPGEKIRTPSIDIMKFTLLHVIAIGGPDAAHYADIRQFFPPESEHAKP